MSQEEMMARASAVQAKYTADLMQKPNVVGLAVGLAKKNDEYTDQIALVVLVSKKLPDEQLASEDRLPDELDGVPVDVQEVGNIVAE